MKRTAQQNGRRSRTKGASYERTIAAKFKPLYPKARRGIGQARSGGEVADVDGVPGWWIQCKHGARPNLYAAMEQADVERVAWAKLQLYTPERRAPMVVARKDGGRDLAMLELDDLLELLSFAEIGRIARRACDSNPNMVVALGLEGFAK